MRATYHKEDFFASRRGWKPPATRPGVELHVDSSAYVSTAVVRARVLPGTDAVGIDKPEEDSWR
jgi:hypothetical protein